MSLSVRYSGLEEAAKEIDRVSKQLQSEIEKLRNQTKQARSYWEGDAEVSFNAADAQFQKRAQSIKTTLDDVARRVRQASSQYSATDAKGAKNFNA